VELLERFLLGGFIVSAFALRTGARRTFFGVPDHRFIKAVDDRSFFVTSRGRWLGADAAGFF
jgi:hypothetical protein